MSNIDKLLNEAETLQDNSEWELITKYARDTNYSDDDGIVNISGKTIDTIKENVSVQGEQNSQYIEFVMDRFFDGVDLASHTIAIHYETNGGGGEDNPVNVYKNDSQIKFGWIIGPSITQQAVSVQFCIWVRGTLSDGKTYVWKTLPQVYPIKQGLVIGGGIPKPDNNWYVQFSLAMDEKVALATESADRAVQAASTVSEVEQVVSQAYEEVSTMHTEVESMRDEVERMKEQVEGSTGVGIAEVGKLGVSKPDGETIDIDEDGTLRCKVEGSKNYEDLENKPSIAGVELSGEKTLDDLGIASKNSVEALGTSLEQTAQKTTELESSLGEATQAIGNLAQTTSQNFETVEETLDLVGEGVAHANDEILATNNRVETLETGLEQTDEKVNTVVEDIHTGFKKQAQGEDVHLTDAVDGKVVDFAMYGKSEQKQYSGKNLLPNNATTQTVNGVTFTINEDKSVSVSGTASVRIDFVLYDDSIDASQFNEKYLSGCVNGSSQTYSLRITDLKTTSNDNTNGNSKIENLTNSGSVRVVIVVQAGVTVNTTFYPMISAEGGEYELYTGGMPSPNPDYPQEIETAGASGSIEVKSCGKNLLKNTATTVIKNGVTFVVNKDGSVTANGTASAWAGFLIDVTLEKGEYILSGCPNNGGYNNYIMYISSSQLGQSYIESGNGVTFTLTETKTFKVECVVYQNITANNLTFYPMIRLATDTDDSYEPYKETVATIPTLNGLPGIKVDSGGNYTDENGQQWITDEIIRYADGSGAFVQRVKKIRLKSTDDWLNITSNNIPWFYTAKLANDFKVLSENENSRNTCGVCSHFSYRINFNANENNTIGIWYGNSYKAYRVAVVSNSIESLDELKTFLDENEVYLYYPIEPITTPLTPEQVTEIEKLHTFSPVTNISNDADCGMSVTYATLQEALMLQEAWNGSKANAQEIISVKEEIVDVKQDLSDTTSRVESIEERAGLGITETASGEEIHLTDSAEGKVVEFALYGKAKQNTTSGNNLFPRLTSATTRSGITYKPNEDGTLSVVGTATADDGVFIVGSSFNGTTVNYSLAKGTYSVSGVPSGAIVFLYKATTSTSGVVLANGNGTLVLNEDTDFTSVSVRVPNGTTIDESSVQIMLNEGTTALPWEPYTNGASPNPDYPQEIEVSGSSYNLLENTFTSRAHNGVTFTANEDKSVTLNGTATANAAFSLSSELIFKANEKYILSGCPLGGSATTYQLDVSNGAKCDYGNSCVIEYENDTITNVRIRIVSGVKFENLTFYPMIRKASVKNDRYMPYGKGSVEVKSVGANLINQVCKSVNGVSLHFLKAGEYTLSRDAIEGGKNWYIGAYDENGSVITKTAIDGRGFTLNGAETYYYGGSSLNTLKIVLKVDCYFEVGVLNGSGTTYFMMSKGDKYEPYQPYKETLSTIPTPNGLAGIKVDSGGNYTDQNGQQWICDEVVKYADGSGKHIQRIYEHKVTSVQNYNAPRIFVPLPLNMKMYGADTSNSILSMCNRFKALMHTGQVTNNDNSCGGQGSGYAFRSDNLGLTTAEEWKTWFTENETIIYYVLETPITTPLTAEELAEISTFYPVTNISNDFDCGMKVEYVGDSIITTNTEIPIVEPNDEEELESGDNIVTLFGKIKKKLKNVGKGVVDVVDNLLSTSTDLPLSANQGRVLNEKITTLNESVEDISKVVNEQLLEQMTALSTRLSVLERNQKTIIYSDTEPETVEENTIVMVYGTEE